MTNPACFPRSPCPITNALDIVGDKWTLLIVRDLLFRNRTYGDFQNAPEHIASNILVSRLQKLEKAGIIDKRAYQNRPVRFEYGLTEKGRALAPILKELFRWSEKYIPGVHGIPLDG